MRIASFALTSALNLFLRRKLPPELFERLAGREVSIEVSEPRLRVSFRVRGRHFVPVRPGGEPWLKFRASARDFASIAAREEDADTLFFNRRLLVEGDTETALLVKNALDCIEAPRTRAVLRRLLRAGG
jgi:predicted lipid carrier protein YhbT